jgi:hypothetical protein
MGKRPNDSVEGEIAGHLGIFINILVIVVINEPVPERLAENQPGYCREKNANADDARAGYDRIIAAESLQHWMQLI